VLFDVTKTKHAADAGSYDRDENQPLLREEYPELDTERLVRFAGLAGRENVSAGADRGFSPRISCWSEVHDGVVCGKFKAMRRGAGRPAGRLWM
jgi:hypothetical protein